MKKSRLAALLLLVMIVCITGCAYYAQDDLIQKGDSFLMEIFGGVIIGLAEGFLIWMPLGMILLFPLGLLIIKLRVLSLEKRAKRPLDRLTIAAVRQEGRANIYPKQYVIILIIGLIGTFLVQRDGSPGQWNPAVFVTEVIPAWGGAFLTGKNLIITSVAAITAGGYILWVYRGLWSPSKEVQTKCQTNPHLASCFDDSVRRDIMKSDLPIPVKKEALNQYAEKADFLDFMEKPEYRDLRTAMIEKLSALYSLDQLAPKLSAEEIRGSSLWKNMSWGDQNMWLLQGALKLPQIGELKVLWDEENREEERDSDSSTQEMGEVLEAIDFSDKLSVMRHINRYMEEKAKPVLAKALWQSAQFLAQASQNSTKDKGMKAELEELAVKPEEMDALQKKIDELQLFVEEIGHEQRKPDDLPLWLKSDLEKRSDLDAHSLGASEPDAGDESSNSTPKRGRLSEEQERVRNLVDVRERYEAASYLMDSFDFTIPGGYKITFLRTESEQREAGFFGPGQNGPISQTMYYLIYKAKNQKAARAFLESQKVEHNYYYVIVETPEGNFGRDINGVYEE